MSVKLTGNPFPIFGKSFPFGTDAMVSLPRGVVRVIITLCEAWEKPSFGEKRSEGVAKGLRIDPRIA